ncbi:hypothetical protein CL630_00275 [bacterium]|nr:hypothetical protein [bacterium]|tara:strand:+ start:6357 stop:6707 length:351 start_codon:yes stop_codon:yes gene_type:complete
MRTSIKQGDIYTSDLGTMEGHEQRGFRPVLIMQNNILNIHLNTIIIAPLTSNLSTKDALTTYFLPKTSHQLQKDSVILLHQIRGIDKTRLRKKIARIGDKEFAHIRKQLSLIFWNI